jgi:hypothetical protein
MGPLAGFGWLRRSLQAGRDNPKAVYGGAAVLLAVLLLPLLVTVPIQLVTMRPDAPPSTLLGVAMMALWTVIGLLVFPLYGGYLRVIDAAVRGKAARAFDVFAPYRQGEVLRFAGFALVMTALYFATVVLLIVVMGGGIGQWYLQALSGQPPQALPVLPPGFGIAMALGAVLFLLMLGVYAIGLGQLALGGRGVFGAIGDGVLGSLKNALPLLVFAISLLVAWIVVALGIGLVIGALVLLGKLVGAWLTIVLVVPLYIALLMAVLVVMFGVMYQLWRDVCGDATTPPAGEAIAA